MFGDLGSQFTTLGSNQTVGFVLRWHSVGATALGLLHGRQVPLPPSRRSSRNRWPKPEDTRKTGNRGRKLDGCPESVPMRPTSPDVWTMIFFFFVCSHRSLDVHVSRRSKAERLQQQQQRLHWPISNGELWRERLQGRSSPSKLLLRLRRLLSHTHVPTKVFSPLFGGCCEDRVERETLGFHAEVPRSTTRQLSSLWTREELALLCFALCSESAAAASVKSVCSCWSAKQSDALLGTAASARCTRPFKQSSELAAAAAAARWKYRVTLTNR